MCARLPFRRLPTAGPSSVPGALLTLALVILLSGCFPMPTETHVEIRADGSGRMTARKLTEFKDAASAEPPAGPVALEYLKGNGAQVHRYSDGRTRIREETFEFDTLADLVLGDAKFSKSIGLEKLGRRFLLAGERRWRLQYRTSLRLSAVDLADWPAEDIELLHAARDGERLDEFWNLPEVNKMLRDDDFDELEWTIRLTVPGPISSAPPLRAGKLVIEPTVSGNTSTWTVPGTAAFAQFGFVGIEAAVEFYADMPIESVASREPGDVGDLVWIPAADDERAMEDFIDSRFGGDELQPGLTEWQYGNCREAAALLEPLAEDGDSDAQFLMAEIYASGYGVEIDQEKGIEWLMRAAQSGHPIAPPALGMLYLLEKSGQQPSAADVRAMLQGAVERDLPMAELALLYLDVQEGVIGRDEASARRAGKMMIAAARDGAMFDTASEMSKSYETGDARFGIPRDLVSAYALKSIQIAGRDPAPSDPAEDLQRIADEFTKEEIEMAQAMAARIWHRRTRFVMPPRGVQCND